MSNPDETSERPTDPASLKPSGEHLIPEVPRIRPLPRDLVAAVHKLPAPNPDSYVEMSIALLLHGLEGLGKVDETVSTLLDTAVQRLNEDADARSAARTGEINANFDLTNIEVQKLAAKLGDLEELVRKHSPRIGSVETAVEHLRTEITTLRADLTSHRNATERRVEQLESELRVLREGTNAAPRPPSTPSKTRKSNPG